MNQHRSVARRPRLLIVAFSCIPGRGSEPGTGWNRAVEAAKFCDTHVICREQDCADGIRDHLEHHGPIAGLTFTFVPRSRWQLRIARLPGLFYLAYNLWQRQVLAVARRLHREAPFDLAHQVNYITFREPGYLWKLDLPFVWGPIGGTQNFPWRFLGGAGPVGAVREALRSLVNTAQLRLSPRVRKAGRRAAALLAANRTVQRDFERAVGLTPVIVPDTGFAERPPLPAAESDESRALRVLWCGVMEPHKGLNLLLDALPGLPEDVAYELRVLGDGSLAEKWRRQATRRGLDPHITWLGWRSHEEALQQFLWADVFVFTSLRDTMGTVVFEALGAGLPVVCLDHQGVGDAVTGDCGIKIPVKDRHSAASGFREALARLDADRGRLQVLSRGAHERAERYRWARLGEEVAAIYQQVLDAVGCDRQCGPPHEIARESTSGRVGIRTRDGLRK